MGFISDFISGSLTSVDASAMLNCPSVNEQCANVCVHEALWYTGISSRVNSHFTLSVPKIGTDPQQLPAFLFSILAGVFDVCVLSFCCCHHIFQAIVLCQCMCKMIILCSHWEIIVIIGIIIAAALKPNKSQSELILYFVHDIVWTNPSDKLFVYLFYWLTYYWLKCVTKTQIFLPYSKPQNIITPQCMLGTPRIMKCKPCPCYNTSHHITSHTIH